MARTSTYLNFPGRTEEAFEFYRTVFGTEIASPIHRMGGWHDARSAHAAERRREGAVQKPLRGREGRRSRQAGSLISFQP